MPRFPNWMGIPFIGKWLTGKEPRQPSIGGPLPEGTESAISFVDSSQAFANNVSYREGYVGSLSPEQRMRFDAMKRQSVRQYSSDYYPLGGALTTVWTQSVSTRRQYLQVLQELRRFYLVEAILDLITQDVLNPDENGSIIEFVCDEADIKDELDEFQKEYDLDNLLMEITPEFINNGEYTLRLEIDPGDGVIAIQDDVNQVGIAAFYDRGVPSNYFIYQSNQFIMTPPYEYAHFVLGNDKIRVPLTEMYNTDQQVDLRMIPQEIRAKIPEYVRIGKPFFFGCVSKIRELQLLEQLIPATKLNQITQSKFVSLKLPATMPTSEVQEALTTYEEIINTTQGVDVTAEQLTLADIIDVAGRIKVLPNFADEKGMIDPLNVREDAAVDDIIRSIVDIRKMILSTIGLPYSLLFGPENSTGQDGDRAAEIRQYGRYARKLVSIQRALAKGLRQMALAHLVNKGFKNVTNDTFDVKFKQSMVDLSGLEKLEYDDAKQEIVGRKIQFLKDMIGEEAATRLILDHANEAGLIEWLTEAFNMLTGGIPLFKEQEKPEVDVDKTVIKDQFINLAIDTFKRNIAARKAGVEPEDPQDLPPHHQVVTNAIDRFKANRDSRNEPEEETNDGGETSDKLLKAVGDAFLRNRQKRQDG